MGEKGSSIANQILAMKEMEKKKGNNSSEWEQKYNTLKEELEEYKNAFTFLKEKLRVEVPVHPLDLVDIEFILVLLNKLTFEGKDVQQVFTTSLKLQEEFKILKEIQENETKKFEK